MRRDTLIKKSLEQLRQKFIFLHELIYATSLMQDLKFINLFIMESNMHDYIYSQMIKYSSRHIVHSRFLAQQST